MALTKVSTDGVKDDAITKTKIPANQIEASELADNAVDTNAIADQAVSLSKLPHGTSSNDGKFLRANNGADPTFETVNTDLVSDTSPQLGGTLDTNGQDITFNGAQNVSWDSSAADLIFNDYAKLNLGTDKDFKAYQDGNNTILQSSNTSGGVYLQGALVQIGSETGEAGFKYIKDGAAELYHNNNLKVQTNNNGLEVHGKLVLGNNDIPSGQISNYSLDVQGDGTNAYIDMGNVFPSFSAGQFPTARFKTVEATKTLEIHSMWGGDNVLYKHIELQADKTKFFRGTDQNVEIAHFGTFGLTFNGDTAAANALDDYEEGSWTPSMVNTGSLSNGVASGRYTKIGRMVHFVAYLSWTARSNNGSYNIKFQSLPFTCASYFRFPIYVGGSEGFSDNNSGTTHIAGSVLANTSEGQFRISSSDGGNEVSFHGDYGSTGGGYLYWGGTYYIN